MKIAFIDYVLDPAKPGKSGLSDVVWNMARELARLGDDVHVIGPYSVEPEPVPGVTVHRFRLPPINYRNIAGHILIVLSAWRVARRIPDLDIIHAPEYLTTGIIAPFSRVPVVLTTPGNIYERIAHGNPFDPITTQVFKLAARSSARWCTLIDAISNDMAWWWQETGASSDCVVVIPHGVDTDRFRPVPGARRSLGIPLGADVVLYAGRLSHEKGVDELLRAAARLVRERPWLHLYIAGDGPARESLRALTAQLGLMSHVSFEGMVPLEAMPSWYSAADVVVLPSQSEALPRVMLEAMACGATFLGAHISGVVDHIRDRETGFLVEAPTSELLARKLQTILENPALARDMGVRARRHAEERLGWPDLMAQFQRELRVRLPASTAGTALAEIDQAEAYE